MMFLFVLIPFLCALTSVSGSETNISADGISGWRINTAAFCHGNSHSIPVSGWASGSLAIIAHILEVPVFAAHLARYLT